MLYSPYFTVIGASGAYYAFQQSDAVGKAIVLLLFFGSIFTWTIMMEKGLSLLKAKRISEEFYNLFLTTASPLTIYSKVKNNDSPVAAVYKKAAEQLLLFYDISPEQAAGRRNHQLSKLSVAEIETIRSVMEREVAGQILLMEDKIGLLATAVSVSPFFGLFGTVWGVMMAFCSVASLGRADISALAPGVSGALLTTVVGLMVAIPSLIGYNLLTITIRKITVYMDNFVEEFMTKIKLEQHDQEYPNP